MAGSYSSSGIFVNSTLAILNVKRAEAELSVILSIKKAAARFSEDLRSPTSSEDLLMITSFVTSRDLLRVRAET